MGEVRDLFIGGLNIRLGACAAAVLCILFLVITRADVKKDHTWIVLDRSGSDRGGSPSDRNCGRG